MQQFTFVYLPEVQPREARVTKRTTIRGVDTPRTTEKRGTAIRELHKLDEHALRDLGLCHDQIPLVVDGLLDRTRSQG